MKKKPEQLRRNARRYAMQALYQWHFTQSPTVLEEFIGEYDFSETDRAYFKTLLNGTLTHLPSLDEALTPLLDRPLNGLTPIELAILRLACFEFLHQPKVPPKVIINEAVELSKEFGAADSYKYINGVLDAFNRYIKKVNEDFNKHKES